MSCSNRLLNKKGPLATVWVAALRCTEALTRDQVASTDIVASVGNDSMLTRGMRDQSVIFFPSNFWISNACIFSPTGADKILEDAQAPQRILALLLLGLVKIYCKKLQYLCDDCNNFYHTFGPRCCAEPSTSTGRSVQVKEAVQVRDKKDTNKVKKSIHAVRITKISGSISSEGLPVRRETEINVQTSVVIREACVSVDMPAFTIPQRFELDSFDLGIADDISLPPEVIGAIDEVNNILDTKGHEPERESQDTDSVWFTPVKDVLPPETMEIIAEGEDPSNKRKMGDESVRKVNMDKDVGSSCSTILPDVLPPEMMEIMAEGKDPSNKRKMGDESVRKVNMDKDVGSSCSTILPEIPEQQISENVLKIMISASPSANYPTIEESENGLFIGKSNTGQSVGGFHENETEENELLGKSNTGLPIGGFQGHEAQELESLEQSISSCKTQAMATNDLSPSTPEPLPGPPLLSTFMVKTPANIERRQSTRKRKRDYYNKEDYLPTEREKRPRRFPKIDEVLVTPNGAVSSNGLSEYIEPIHAFINSLHCTILVICIHFPCNSIMKAIIDEEPDTARTRKMASHTHLASWKLAKIGSLPDNFMDPLIPCNTSVNLDRLTTPEAPENSCGESVKARRRLSYKLSESSKSCKASGATEQENVFDKPRKRKSGGPTEFEVPVGSDTESGHPQDDVCGCNNDTAKEQGTHIKGDEPILTDKGLHESENYTSLHTEALCTDPYNIDLLQDTPMDEEHTRDEGSVYKLSFVLTLYYEFELHQALICIFLLCSGFISVQVLKNRGLIEVNQEQPYEDIMLSPTPQLEAELQRPSGGTS
ncbi:hypothetical protein PR202_gb15212 [Eleusine coracana subsp. coracana]|uniref:Uncharacterized protein n=1 Tax=Eleusine coracana subsp. coracana TaxID=191504 RepID=A0AAV5EXA1_ELECO|nr:hypothetical protein PR202_gb15212 [Eleusine coracana subsp. coracana]